MVDYAEAIKKPFQDLQTLAIGTIIGAVPIVSLLLLGYGVGVARNTINGDNKQPKWEINSLAAYIKDLIFAAVIDIIYLVPGIVVIAVGAAAALLKILPVVMAGNLGGILPAIGQGIAAGGLIMLLGVILAAIGSFFAAIGILLYAKNNSIGSAFSLGSCLKTLLTLKFWITFVVGIIWAVILMIPGIIIAFIPVLGVFLSGGFVTYTFYTSWFTMLAEAFKETQ